MTLPKMDDKQFYQWAELLEQRTGTSLPVERKSFLVTSIGLRMREIGCPDYQSYYDLIVSAPGRVVEWATLVDRLTVHETRFFRHPESLRLIRERCLPRSADGADRLSVNAWSMGCSTGEEAYSLAIVIDQHLASLGVPYYLSVTATDISRSALTAARHGVYNRRKLIGMDPTIMQRYFVAMEQEQYQVSEALRQRVCFSQMNIVEDKHAALGEMDIIYCQNVLIYFNRSRRLDILNTLMKYLRPGGVLVLGPGEVTDWSNPRVERLTFENTLAYRRLPALNGQPSSMAADGLTKECAR